VKRLSLIFDFVLLGVPALAQGAIPCAWNNVPLHDKIAFSTTNFANSGNGVFVVEGFQLQTACTMTGTFTVDVMAADATTNYEYAFGLYYNSGGQSTAGTLWATTGQFTGKTYFGSISSGVNIPASTTGGLCAGNYPSCTLPAGMYAIAMATNCTGNSTSCPVLGGDDSLGGYSAFWATSNQYSSGLPSSITIAPVAVNPVLFRAKHAISVLVW